MDTERTRSATAWGANSSFNIVVACEDSDTGARALRVCGRIIGRLWRDFTFTTDLWKFGDPAGLNPIKSAPQPTKTTDMVILSTHDRRELPGEVKQWLRSWINDPAKPRRALVALLDEHRKGGDGPSSTELFLRSVTSTSNVDLFCFASERGAGELPPLESLGLGASLENDDV
ncbi:MAG TPA: hypothetical protein VNO52_03750, partial [Methylomirabilota bacterium]|nr:hypothetical protein [Methylomirabilota bacterium]